MNIEAWPVDRPTPYPNNPRVNDRAVEKVAASIKEFGFRQPIVVDEDGVILVGPTRLKAARHLELSEVPVHQVTDLDEAQKKAYRLADNRLGELATWDEELLGFELKALDELPAGHLTLTGFSVHQLAKYLAPQRQPGATDPDTIPAAPLRAALGDVWAMGDHRVLCGDSTQPAVVGRLWNGKIPGLMVTDPPYGVRYDPNWRRRIDGGKQRRDYIAGDEKTDWTAAWELFPGHVAYIWHSDRQITEVAQALTKIGFEPRQQIIWAKTKAAISRRHYSYQHEHCWYAVRIGNVANWCGRNDQTTLWGVKGDVFKWNHAAQKPVECMARPIENHKIPIVYDPFLGTGTTVIAAEQLGRTCFGVELVPKFVDVVLERWAQFTEREPEKIDELVSE